MVFAAVAKHFVVRSVLDASREGVPSFINALEDSATALAHMDGNCAMARTIGTPTGMKEINVDKERQQREREAVKNLGLYSERSLLTSDSTTNFSPGMRELLVSEVPSSMLGQSKSVHLLNMLCKEKLLQEQDELILQQCLDMIFNDDWLTPKQRFIYPKLRKHLDEARKKHEVTQEGLVGNNNLETSDVVFYGTVKGNVHASRVTIVGDVWGSISGKDIVVFGRASSVKGRGLGKPEKGRGAIVYDGANTIEASGENNIFYSNVTRVRGSFNTIYGKVLEIGNNPGLMREFRGPAEENVVHGEVENVRSGSGNKIYGKVTGKIFPEAENTEVYQELQNPFEEAPSVLQSGSDVPPSPSNSKAPVTGESVKGPSEQKSLQQQASLGQYWRCGLVVLLVCVLGGIFHVLRS